MIQFGLSSICYLQRYVIIPPIVGAVCQLVEFSSASETSDCESMPSFEINKDLSFVCYMSEYENSPSTYMHTIHSFNEHHIFIALVSPIARHFFILIQHAFHFVFAFMFVG